MDKDKQSTGLGREQRKSLVESVNSCFVFFGKYPRLKDTSFTGVTVEECKLILATGNEANEVLFD